MLLISLPELIPEEAYYWNYAQHLALGYLDHPPLSAWLIAASVKLLGNSEFSVRLPAWLCSITSLFFAFHLVKEAFDRRTAWFGAAIFASVPYFFGIGMAITPDAPLVTWWAASLYFLLCLIKKSENLSESCWKDWLGLGLCLGLGMLSKYTIALVGLSSLVVFIWHPPLRRYFLRPQPYLAVIVALAVFSPVIYWNATHEWASFAFQGSRRLNSETTFGLPLYLLHLLALATPTGIVAAGWFYWRSRREASVSPATLRFCAALFLFPVAVFLFFSLRHGTKIIWAGPAFLAALPLMARHLALGLEAAKTRTERYLYKSWMVMLPASLIGFAAVIYYPA
ncbi:MAG: glycosyltransferase family 39 protein, partial [Methanothrix sp.]